MCVCMSMRLLCSISHGMEAACRSSQPAVQQPGPACLDVRPSTLCWKLLHTG